MRDATSGLLFTEKDDGSIIVEVVDYGISEYGGGDLEMSFYINKENADKLKNALKAIHKGNFEEMLKAEFGETFNIPAFTKFCANNGVKYSYSSWYSD